MSDVNIVRGDNILQESISAVKTFNTNLWSAIIGTPAYNAGVIDIDQASMRTLVGAKNFAGFIEILIPTAPTTGDAREWGFKNAGDNSPGAYFYIDGEEFGVVVLDDFGAELVSAICKWNSDWTDASVVWGVTTFKTEIHFTVNGSLLYRYMGSVPERPLTVFISNTNNDVMEYSELSIS
jgi:hypothetical protein